VRAAFEYCFPDGDSPAHTGHADEQVASHGMAVLTADGAT
jgi:hypothetical protein